MNYSNIEKWNREFTFSSLEKTLRFQSSCLILLSLVHFAHPCVSTLLLSLHLYHVDLFSIVLCSFPYLTSICSAVVQLLLFVRQMLFPTNNCPNILSLELTILTASSSVPSPSTPYSAAALSAIGFPFSIFLNTISSSASPPLDLPKEAADLTGMKLLWTTQPSQVLWLKPHFMTFSRLTDHQCFSWFFCVILYYRQSPSTSRDAKHEEYDSFWVR